MGEIIFDIENCYGIGSLKQSLNLEENKVSIIHAPNGTMKTSLINTLDDINQKRLPTDYVKPSNKSIVNVMMDGKKLGENDFYIVKSFIDNYESKQISNLLLDSKLKKQYEKIVNQYIPIKSDFIKRIQKKSGLNEDLFSDKLKDIFKKETFEENLLEAFKWFQKEEFIFDELILVKYELLFSQKIEDFVKKVEVRNNIQKYVRKIKKLNSTKQFFKEGEFEISNLVKVKDALLSNKYFNPGNKIILNGYDNVIDSIETLETIIQSLYKLQNAKEDVNKVIRNLSDELSKSEPMREFNSRLQKNNSLVLRYSNLKKFKKDYILNLILSEITLCEDLIREYIKYKEDIKKIFIFASSEQKEWKETVDVFNSRFDVPFRLSISNAKDAVLGLKMPIVEFEYDGLPIEKSKLNQVLSTGESRALYLLNIIFDLRYFEKNKIKKTIVFDDVADSFDYKNKHAIILYLKDLSNINDFNLLVLTHNFDFYRTCGNLLSERNLCYFALKDKKKISFEKGEYLKNILQYYLNNANKDVSILLSTISFARNYHELNIKNPKDEAKYNFFTNLLHYRYQGKRVTLKKLSSELGKSFNGYSFNNNDTQTVYKKWGELADKIAKDSILMQKIERKIVLSTASRLCAEEYIFRKIKRFDPKVNYRDFKESYGNLLFEYLKYCPKDKNRGILENVAKLSPEAIHINAFMYEPLIDYSENVMKNIYLEIKKVSYLF